MVSKIINALFSNQHSIAMKLLLAVFSIYLVIAIIISLLQMIIEYQKAHDDISQSIHTIAQTSHSSISLAMWDLNQTQLESIVSGLIKLPEISGAVLYDDTDSVVFSTGEVSPSFSAQISPFNHPITHPYRNQQMIIGQLTLSAPDNVVLNRVGLGFVLLVISAVIKTLCLWLIFLYFSRALLQEPLAQITSQIKTTQLNQTLNSTTLDKTVYGETELTLLSDTFHDMTATILDTQQALKSMNESLEQRIAERTHELTDKNKQLTEAQRRLEEASTTDPLTGWRNRRFLEQNIEADTDIIIRTIKDWQQQDQQAVPESAGLILYLLDIDHFKGINDEYGHHAGDLMLKQFCSIIASVFRRSDYLVRWGGEEFLIVARFTSVRSIEHVSKRILELVEEHLFDIDRPEGIHCTCSVGVTQFPFNLAAPETLSFMQTIEVADMALYLAKQNGRNAWVAIQNNSTENVFDYDDLAVTHEKIIINDQLSLSSSIKGLQKDN